MNLTANLFHATTLTGIALIDFMSEDIFGLLYDLGSFFLSRLSLSG
jgi:hypothetical protein